VSVCLGNYKIFSCMTAMRSFCPRTTGSSTWHPEKRGRPRIRGTHHASGPFRGKKSRRRACPERRDPWPAGPVERGRQEFKLGQQSPTSNINSPVIAATGVLCKGFICGDTSYLYVPWLSNSSFSRGDIFKYPEYNLKRCDQWRISVWGPRILGPS
jgi:hypothetical protein